MTAKKVSPAISLPRTRASRVKAKSTTPGAFSLVFPILTHPTTAPLDFFHDGQGEELPGLMGKMCRFPSAATSGFPQPVLIWDRPDVGTSTALFAAGAGPVRRRSSDLATGDGMGALRKGFLVWMALIWAIPRLNCGT